jgi:hypothetical protein
MRRTRTTRETARVYADVPVSPTPCSLGSFNVTVTKSAERIEAQRRSGTSVKQFCKERGLTEYSFYACRKRLQEKGPVLSLWWKGARGGRSARQTGCSRTERAQAGEKSGLDVREQIEVFIVFVLATLAATDGLLRFDEFNPLDPLHHFVAKLVLDPQPQWSSVGLGKGLAIHL